MSDSPAVPGQGTQDTEKVESSAEQGEQAYHRAKMSLLLFIASFILSVIAFSIIWGIAGYTTVWAMRYPSGAHSPSGWAARGIWVLLTALYVWPLFVVIHFARKARRLGRGGWPLPVILASVIAAFFPLLNLAMLAG